MKKIIWEIYLIRSQHAVEAWMDTREQSLIIKHLQKFNQATSGRESIMLEYGAGSSTFVYSAYVHRYVSIEHSVDYCRILERMAAGEPTRSVIISYMKSVSSGYVETHRFEQNIQQSNGIPFIQVYCIAPTYSMLGHRFWHFGGRSTYSMYQNYIDFISIHFQHQLFDFVLIDGRARPQVAYVVLKHLDGLHGKVFVHDWNQRRGYHVIVNEFYNIIDQQIESNQLGGGGLVVLEKKHEIKGEENLDEIHWQNSERPDWWL